MRVEWNFFGPMRDAVGTKTVERTLADDASVRDAVDDVVATHPELADHLLDDGALDASTNLTKNGTNVAHLDGGATPLSDGDVLRAALPVVGGET